MEALWQALICYWVCKATTALHVEAGCSFRVTKRFRTLPVHFHVPTIGISAKCKLYNLSMLSVSQTVHSYHACFSSFSVFVQSSQSLHLRCCDWKREENRDDLREGGEESLMHAAGALLHVYQALRSANTSKETGFERLYFKVL